LENHSPEGSMIPDIKGPFTRIECLDIDLNSFDQVKTYLLSIGWKPTRWNVSKTTREITSPKLTEDSFDSIEGDLGKLIARRWVLRHRRNTVQNYKDPENKGILAAIREDGRVAAEVITCNAVTGRCTHTGVVVNIPKAKPKLVYGKEMRSIFCVRDPYVMLGADLKQIEAVVTAHYANLFDGGEYIKVLNSVNSIHDYNAALIERDRDTAKSFQYSLFYGARAPKLASILKCSKKKAEVYIENFWNGNKGIKLLIDYLEKYYKKYGFIKGLDGRKIFIRAEYKLLNSLIQTGAGIIFKKWGVLANEGLRRDGLQCFQMMNFHDEYDYRCHQDHVDDSSFIIKDAATRSGEYFKLAMPVEVDVKVGKNWAQVH